MLAALQATIAQVPCSEYPLEAIPLVKRFKETRADLIADGQINVSELQTYVVDQVRKLTDDCQHPYIPRLERFDPGLVLAQTR